MKKITVNNYEAFFLDYIEGTLDDATTRELESFLLLHPHLKNELSLGCGVQLPSETIVFSGKEALKKFQFENMPVNAATFADFSIAAYEGLLSENKREELAIFMQADGGLLKEYIAYGKTIFIPDNIIYPDKEKLYQRAPVVNFRTVYMWGAVAAGLLLFIGIYTGFFNNKTVEQTHLATSIPSQNKVKEPILISTREVAVAPAIEKAKTKPSSIIKIDTRSLANHSDEVIQIEDAEIEVEPVDEPQLAAIVKEPIGNGNTDALFDSLKTTKPATDINAEDGEKHKLLALVEEGVEKINKVTKSDNLALAHQTTPTGKIKSFSIKLGFIGFERKKARN